jgi:hypothetical protein
MGLGAAWIRARSEIRSNLKATASLAVVIGLAGALVMGAIAGARRTATSYDRLVAASNAADLLLPNGGQFFGFATLDFDKIARFPQVADSARFSFLVANADISSHLKLTPVGGRNVFVSFAGPDNKFDTVLNRMHALRGRLADPNADDEVTVSYVFERRYHTEPGDELTIHLFYPGDLQRDLSATPTGPAVRLRVTGVEVSPGELPPGLGYPQIHLTPAFYKRYTPGTVRFEALEVKLRDRSQEAGFLDQIDREGIVPGPGGVRSVQRFSIADVSKPINRSIHLQATALWLVALLGGVSSVLIIMQLLSRQSAFESTDNATLRSLGMTGDDLFRVALIRAVVGGLMGAAIAILGAIALSSLAPIGLARVAELHRGVSIDVAVAAIGAAAVVAIVVIGCLPGAFRLARGIAPRRPRESVSRLAQALTGAAFPSTMIVGVRMALEPGRGRTAVPVRSTILGVAIGIAAILTALTFASSLDHLLHTPRLAGWNWDAQIGDDFDTDTSGFVLPILQKDARIGGISTGTTSTVQIGGKVVPVIALDPIRAGIGPTLLEGVGPRAANEIALGTKTLRDVGARVGGDVTLTAGARTAVMRVVGRIIAPPIGDSRGIGIGAFMTYSGVKQLIPDVPRNVHLIRTSPGTDRKALLASLHERMKGLAIQEGPLDSDIVEFGRVDKLPLVLAGTVGVMALASLAHTLVTGIRRRRRDLAILRAMGFLRWQLSGTIAVLSTTLALAALSIAIPIGVLAGRWLFTVFADQIGTKPEPAVRLLATLGVFPVALIFANAIAFLPGRRAGRVNAASVLRTE